MKNKTIKQLLKKFVRAVSPAHPKKKTPERGASGRFHFELDEIPSLSNFSLPESCVALLRFLMRCAFLLSLHPRSIHR